MRFEMPGDIIVSLRNKYPIRYGILSDQNTVIWLVAPNILKPFASVVEISLNLFKEYGEPHFIEVPDRAHTLLNARSLLHTPLDGFYNLYGDDLIYLCVQGSLMEPDSGTFGEHLTVDLHLPHSGKITRHGIGIENHQVVHFYTDDSTASAKSSRIQIISLEEFCQGAHPQIQEYEEPFEEKIFARNKALNLYREQDKCRLFANCFQMAYWCKTNNKGASRFKNLLKTGSVRNAFSVHEKDQVGC